MTNTPEIKITPCKWDEISSSVTDYFTSNKITIESFYEDHVLSGNHYKFMCGDELAGYFAIHEGSTVVLFNVFPHYANQAQELFARVKKYESVTNAMVATGDEFFISHCVDNFQRIEKQAYFSIYTEKEISAEKTIPLTLRLADVDKDEELFKLSKGFLDGEADSIRNGLDVLKIYIAELDSEIVGFGVIQYGQIVKDIASIGMYVCEEFRRKGIAANILQNLKHIAWDNGCRAFSGCWYYNHNSKKSMESAGAYSKSRLVRFFF